MAYSGGAVVDRHNTLDIEAGPEDPIVASFTSTGRGECLALSLDRGRTFTDFPGNPVLRHTGRDPKVIWYEPSQKWVLIVYEELADQRGYALYDSHDLQRWTRLVFLPGFYECPELFELAVDGDPERKKWIIYGSTWQQYLSAYLIGDFDGATFTPAGEPLSAHCGPHFYAAQTFSHVPDGRVIMLGWLRLGWQPGDEFPGMPFGHGMTIPLELSLCSTPQGLRLCFLPVQELQNLHTGTIAAQNLTIPQANRLLAEVRDELLDIQVTIQPHSPQPFQIDLRGHPILYHPAQNEISFAGKTASLLPILDSFELRLLIDRSVTEVFADQGYAAFSAMTIFPEDSLPITLQGDVTIQSLTIHPLRSIWHDEGS